MEDISRGVEAPPGPDQTTKALTLIEVAIRKN